MCVVFGITGDLARVMTFRALYRLEAARPAFSCRVVGVAFDDWTLEHLVERARESIVATGEPLDEAVFKRFVEKLSYLRGDFADAATYGRVASFSIKGASLPVFYLEIPPSLFATVVSGLADAGLTKGARVVVEKPFGHDLASAREFNHQLHALIAESQLYRIDHFLGKLSVEYIASLRGEHDPGAGLEPTTTPASRSRWRRTLASPTAAISTTPWAPCATSSRTTSCRCRAVAMEPRTGRAPDVHQGPRA